VGVPLLPSGDRRRGRAPKGLGTVGCGENGLEPADLANGEANGDACAGVFLSFGSCVGFQLICSISEGVVD